MPVEDITAPRGGRIVKVIGLDATTNKPVGEFPTKALIDDPFANVSGYGRKITTPPYSLEQLVLLAEAHPVHSACIEQKVSDIIASGPKIVSREDDKDLADNLKNEVMRWWEGLFDDYTPIEVMQAIENDNQTLANGFMEIARDKKGNVAALYPLPAHTMRAHSSGTLWVQMRWGHQRWFKLWGDEKNYRLGTGIEVKETEGKPPEENEANEVLVFRRPSRRSTWYGIPGYVSAIGHLTLAINARDYNAQFFMNNREPRILYIVTGLEEDIDDAIDQMADQLNTQHAEPHKSIFLPLTGTATKVQIERVGMPTNDLHFTRLMEMCDVAIMTSHRVPGDRLGVAARGLMGGSVANVTNRIYKDAIVARGQDFIEDRLTKFMVVEFHRSKGKEIKNVLDAEWRVDLEELDTRDEAADTNIVVNLVAREVITLNEGRAKLNLPPRDEFKEDNVDLTLSEWMAKNAPEPPPMMAMPGQIPGNGAVPNPDVEQGKVAASYPDGSVTNYILRKLEDIDALTEELLLADDDPYGFPALSANGHSR